MNVYIHIPFCISACEFCFYVKEVGTSVEERSRYLEALGAEIRHRRAPPPTSQPTVRTVYVGGGTPSLLSVYEWQRLAILCKEVFGLESIEEFTVECNPAALTRAKLEALRDAGADRISFGVQNVDDDLLEKMGRSTPRVGTMESLRRAVKEARGVGFENINCDLLLGLPGECDASVEESVALLLDLAIPHIAVYPLQVGVTTPLFARLLTGRARLEAHEARLTRYRGVLQKLQDSGYIRVGIAYFVRDKRFECRQHQSIWNGDDLMGFGVSAQSFEQGRYGRNRRTIAEYLASVPDHTFAVHYELGEADQVRRWALMRLSRKLGFKRVELQTRWGGLGVELLAPFIDELMQAGLAQSDGDWVILTQAGAEQTARLPVEFLRFDHADYLADGLRVV